MSRIFAPSQHHQEKLMQIIDIGLIKRGSTLAYSANFLIAGSVGLLNGTKAVDLVFLRSYINMVPCSRRLEHDISGNARSSMTIAGQIGTNKRPRVRPNLSVRTTLVFLLKNERKSKGNRKLNFQ